MDTDHRIENLFNLENPHSYSWRVVEYIESHSYLLVRISSEQDRKTYLINFINTFANYAAKR